MKFELMQQKAMQSWSMFDADQPRILIGTATCGKAAGADSLMALIQAYSQNTGLDALICEVGCIGLCYLEPLIELSRPGSPRVLCGPVTEETIPSLLASYFKDGTIPPDAAIAVMQGEAPEGVPHFADHPVLAPQKRVVLRNCGLIDPDNLDHYIARGGYSGLVRALAMDPQEVITEVENSGLRGRGGAGFPTALKWRFCREAQGDHKYMICNADEGDPGAFMDRSVIEGDPHAVIEGIVIAAYAIGAADGYIYVRAEYPLAIKRLETAMQQARDYNLLGDNILDSGFSLHLKLKKGAGAFVCGEETALLASIEGKRGMPNPRPPFPAQQGLYGMPTTINNVETMANVSAILEKGSDWYVVNGTEKSRGTKTFALAGKITRTGLIEVPLGITLREIVEDIGGGIPNQRKFKAVQTGGPSGGCIPESLIDMPVDYERLAEAGAIMGSGGMVVMDQDTCMVDIARYFLEFTQNESCGKCAPCRLGTKQMLGILTRITEGKGKPEDIDLLEEIGDSVKKGSLCGLGQTAPNPALTTLQYFRDEYDAHINEKRCPAGACKALLTYEIDADKCICCSRCANNCPVDCISGKAGKPPAKASDEDRAAGKAGKPFVIDQDICTRCGNCFDVCPVDTVMKR